MSALRLRLPLPTEGAPVSEGHADEAPVLGRWGVGAGVKQASSWERFLVHARRGAEGLRGHLGRLAHPQFALPDARGIGFTEAGDEHCPPFSSRRLRGRYTLPLAFSAPPANDHRTAKANAGHRDYRCEGHGPVGGDKICRSPYRDAEPEGDKAGCDAAQLDEGTPVRGVTRDPADGACHLSMVAAPRVIRKALLEEGLLPDPAKAAAPEPSPSKAKRTAPKR